MAELENGPAEDAGAGNPVCLPARLPRGDPGGETAPSAPNGSPQSLSKALRLTARGKHVFPCRPDKRPYTGHGFKDATRDEHTLRAWWRRWPDALVGLPTGRVNGLAVLDLDRKDGKDGLTALTALGLNVPSPLTIATPSGGEHRFFRYPPDTSKIASASDLFKTLLGQEKTGIDIRGDGGYVVAWGELDSIDWAELPDWPAAIVEALHADEVEREARGGSAGEVLRYENSTGFDHIRDALTAIPADDREVWRSVGMALKAALNETGRPVWDEWSRQSKKFNAREQDKIWKSFRGRGVTIATLFWHAQQNGWRGSPNGANKLEGTRGPARVVPAKSSSRDEWPELQKLISKIEPEPYPAVALPGAIRVAVREVHTYVQAPIEMVAMSALSALSVAAQAHADVKRSNKLTGPVSLFLLAVADSGERKTSLDTLFTACLREYQRRREVELEPEVNAFKAKLAAWYAAKEGHEAAIRQAAKNGEDATEHKVDLDALEKAEPAPPRVPCLIRADDTPESLAWGLAKGWPSTGIISAEAGLVFGSHAMGADAIMRTLALHNTLWDGKEHRIGRRTSESFTVRGARLTISLQIQEMTLRAFMGKNGDLARGIGFFARFLLAWPRSAQGFRLFVEAPEVWPELANFEARLSALLEATPLMDDRGALTLPVLEMAPDAKAAWVELYNRIENELRPGGHCCDIKDVASKAAENIARLAALFHIFEHGASGRIGAQTVKSAGQIVLWHLNEARRFFGEFAMAPELTAAVRLEAWLIERCKQSQQSRIPRSDVLQFGPYGLRDKKSLDAALAELAELGRVRETAEGRKRLIEVHPGLLGMGR